ncbi:hypothetical protein E2C01_067731 [Portunus trituberculatus]|uniref:Uncharacterized protein n=1 Tax=Portunus trituberculatus TaxID=210409 RepID=A0A5B7HTN8_PORTR|nr:hypothetical protein [Portunus trituberculatus]
MVRVSHDDAADDDTSYLASELVVIDGPHLALPSVLVDAVLDACPCATGDIGMRVRKKPQEFDGKEAPANAIEFESPVKSSLSSYKDQSSSVFKARRAQSSNPPLLLSSNRNPAP